MLFTVDTCMYIFIETLRCYALERHELDLREILQEDDQEEHYSVTVK